MPKRIHGTSQRKYHRKNVYAHFNPSANIYPSICLRCCTIITANEKYYAEKRTQFRCRGLREDGKKIQYRRSYFSIKSS